ncbi:protein red1 [Aspergillus udagawae]|nr:protein red1 [Aspergillus udagawae]
MPQHPPAPSIGGPPHTQQWSRSHIFPSTSMPSSLAPHIPFSQDISSAQQPQDNGNQPFNYNGLTNLNMTSNLPGLGGPVAGLPLPPPPFPFMGPFTPSQFHHHSFPPIQMPPLRYPPLPLPAANSQAPSRPSSRDLRSQANSMSMNGADSRATTTPSTRKDYDREEGELTDMEVAMPTSSENAGLSGTRADARPSTLMQQNGYATGTYNTTTVAGNKESRRSPATKNRDASTLDLEEGEASSTGSHISARESESPYDPPGSVNPEPFVSNGAPVASPHEDRPFALTRDVSASHGSGKSVAQLRIQAQGALLRLAPHNIRYSELVGEGINPAVLRQLYEEVGIRVPTPQLDGVSPTINPPTKPVDVPVKPAAAVLDSSSSSNVENGPASVTFDHSKRETEIQVAAAAAANTPAPVSTSTTQPSTTAKPLERKEVIARMLAAKAAKASGTPSTPQTDSAKEAQPSESPVSALVGKGAPASSGHEIPSKDKDIRTREKNKAKTELARQRIEQLKKQGLVRSQQKAQIDSLRHEEIPQSNGSSPAPVSQASHTPMIQHPLPDRPPDPESTAPSRIPGLFMTESSEPSVTRVRGLVVDSTPQPHVNQRKRPRASDFDEPSFTPKRSHNGVNYNASEGRLIIDISDDEFYGDDENEEMEIKPAGKTTLEGGSVSPEGLSGTVPSLADLLLQRPTASSQGISASATPQSHRNHDQEDLRKKDLEIQAMRRRIAELEQRKKAKLAASRTQSPRPSEIAVSSPAINPASVDQGHQTTIVISEPVAHKLPPQVALLEAATEAIFSVPANISDNPENLSSESIARISALKDNADYLEEMRSKLLRKKEIESGVPALDAEIQKSEARLAEVKVEEQNLLRDIAKGKEGRQQLLEELHSLNLELNGLTLEELEIAERTLDAKEQVQASDAGSTDRQSSAARHGSATPDVPAAEARSQGAACPAQGSPVSRLAFEAGPAATSDLSMDADESGDAVDPASDAASSSPSESLGSAMDESADSSEDSVQADSEEPMECETPTPEPSVHEALSGIPATDRKTVEDEITPDQTLPERQRTPHAPDAGNTGDVLPPNADEVQELEKQASRGSSISDAYEPPEPEADSSPADSVYTPPFSPVSLASVKSAEVSRVEGADMPLMGKVQELEVQPEASSPHGLSNNGPQEKAPRFTPYISPLRWFKAYRYHPRFTENVSGGFRSLTYSHNIDSEKYLCPYEATGGVCNDRSCDLQHFRDMTLSDDKILVQMGSLREGKTPEEKDQYIAGLKQIINEMRRDKVKDFNTVATEIAAYRRRFLQDPSRVLPL